MQAFTVQTVCSEAVHGIEKETRSSQEQPRGTFPQCQYNTTATALSQCCNVLTETLTGDEMSSIFTSLFPVTNQIDPFTLHHVSSIFILMLHFLQSNSCVYQVEFSDQFL